MQSINKIKTLGFSNEFITAQIIENVQDYELDKLNFTIIVNLSKTE